MRVAVLTVSMLAVSGCSVLRADSCSVDTRERPAEVVTTPELSPVPQRRADVGLVVTSTSQDPVRVTVHLEGKRALDVELPGSGATCAHDPVYRYGYDLPADRVRVAVTTGQGQRASRTFRASHGKRWLVVQVQDGFPLVLGVSKDPPTWG